MKLRYKILNSLLGLLILFIGAIAVTMSYTADCEPRVDNPIETNAMKAITYRCYGGPEVLEFVDITKPTPASGEVLVKVHAAGVNPLDYHYMRGTPYIMRLMGSGIGAPESQSMGVDFSGVVESVGENVTKFKVGDAVFGGRSGAFAEYLIVPEDKGIALKPDNISHEQAAGVAIAGITALQAVRDLGQVKAGDKVLVNGASGGVGTFAVQIAKYLGADVTGVNSTRNVEMVLGIGADRVIDYKKEDYISQGVKYDVIVDMVANNSLSKNLGILTPDGRMVNVGAIEKGNWIGPLIKPIASSLMNPFVEQEIQTLFARILQDDLKLLAKMMAEGKLTTVLDKSYALSEVGKAITYSESGRARGKIIIKID